MARCKKCNKELKTIEDYPSSVGFAGWCADCEWLCLLNEMNLVEGIKG